MRAFAILPMVLGIVSLLGHVLCVEGVSLSWNPSYNILGRVEFVAPFVSCTFIQLQYGRAWGCLLNSAVLFSLADKLGMHIST